MAITRTQQARQMLKKGSKKPVVQGGVDNYLGDQPQVVVPRKWQSGPNKPPTELAYITEAEKKLLLKEDIHGSLKEGPNKGPGGVMSLDSFGDIGGAGAAGVDTDVGGGYDTGPGGGGFTGQGPNETRQDFENRKDQQRRNLENIKAQQEEKAEKMRKEARATRKKMSDLKKADRKKRQQRIKNILSGKIANFGLTETQLADLEALGISPEQLKEDAGLLGTPDYQGGRVDQDLIDQFMEKSDRFSGVDMETFKEKFNMPDLPGVLGMGLKLFEGPLKKGSRKTKDFFVDRTLPYGAFTYEGLGVTPEMFGYLSPLEQQEIFGDYATRRGSGEIDAMGRPVPPDDSGPSDPCLGPNPPAYCFIGQRAETPPEDPIFTPSFRFMNRGGMVEDAPMGGIMDLETTRQMLFIGGVAKAIGKGLKSVTRGIKKVAKSPLGKAAILGTIGYGLGGGFGLKPGGFSFSNLPGAKFLSNMTLPKLITDNMTGLKVAGLSGLAGLLLANVGKDDDDDFDIEEYYRTAGINIPENQYRFLAEGGSTEKEPVAKKTMPLLDLEGQEMDFRQDGGFVPIGRMEKADDVPARLSKNEFVFTAEAVRNAGGGDVDKGAEVMYNTMKNLEAGGEVSEETQGLEGARNMFQTSQRLGEVV
jgi:hypothetical protein